MLKPYHSSVKFDVDATWGWGWGGGSPDIILHIKTGKSRANKEYKRAHLHH